jgi:glutaredoxin
MKYWTIIGRDGCPWCDKAVEYLHDNGAEYAYINLSDPKNGAFRLTVKAFGVKTVPQVINPDGELIGGYEDLIKYLEGSLE